MTPYLMLAALGVAAFVQNMAFTWVSRSRNSGDPSYHRWAAICSNGIWFATQLLVIGIVWPALTQGDFTTLFLTAVVYITCTTEGSVLMMKILIKTETGKRKVGA